MTDQPNNTITRRSLFHYLPAAASGVATVTASQASGDLYRAAAGGTEAGSEIHSITKILHDQATRISALVKLNESSLDQNPLDTAQLKRIFTEIKDVALTASKEMKAHTTEYKVACEKSAQKLNNAENLLGLSTASTLVGTIATIWSSKKVPDDRRTFLKAAAIITTPFWASHAVPVAIKANKKAEYFNKLNLELPEGGKIDETSPDFPMIAMADFAQRAINTINSGKTDTLPEIFKTIGAIATATVVYSKHNNSSERIFSASDDIMDNARPVGIGSILLGAFTATQCLELVTSERKEGGLQR